MVKTLSTREARANFSDVLGGVYYTKDPVFIERNGKPFAVIVSPDEYELFRQAREALAWDALDRSRERNAGVDPDAVLADVTATVDAARQERRARRAG